MKKIHLSLMLAAVLAMTALGQTSENVVLKGLTDSVTVTRDGRYIPYISAKNESDLYLVQGFVTASDRMWQMDMFRRVARGETAELFGRVALEEDKRWRRFGFASVAEQNVKYLKPELRKALEDYAAGVNLYIDSLTDENLPAEFKILQYKPRKWTVADSLTVGKILSDALNNSYGSDIQREALLGIDKQKFDDLYNGRTDYDVLLFGKDTKRAAATEHEITSPKQPRISAELAEAMLKQLEARQASLDRIGFYAEETAASNNWVVSGKRTASGKPILANDPHLRPTAPGIWYLTHLATTNDRVAGVTFPGVPGIVAGHNEHIAWGVTNVGPDVQDVYIETLNEKNEYKTADGWAPLKIRTEEIKVRENLLKPDTVVEKLEVKETKHGPIIISDTKRSISLKWTAFEPKDNEFSAFFYLNRAKNWEEFKRALSDYSGPMQNFVYADVNNNIGWYAAGKIPIRRKGTGELPYDSTSTDGDWVGFVPFNELPNLYNPPEGFIMTANQRIVGTDYKHQQLARDFAMPWRAKRLHDLISADSKATIRSNIDWQHDAYNIPLSMLAKRIVALKAASDDSLKLYADWNGIMEPDSRAALFVNEVRNCAAAKLAEANKPIPVWMIRERILYWVIESGEKRWLPAGFDDYGALLKECDGTATDNLTKRYGEDKNSWTWGQVSKASFPHPMAAIPLLGGRFATPTTPVSGSGQTPNVASAVSMRHVTSPGDWDSTHYVIPLGQSGDAASPFYKDQFDKWRTGEHTAFPFTEKAVNEAAKTKMIFIGNK